MNDEDIIRSVALDYIEGWYEGNKKRMDQALHPKLVKRRFVSKDEIWAVDKPWMVNAAEEGIGKIDNPATAKKDVTILDIHETVASVKIISEKFVDYLHLLKENEHWKIVDVLWEYL